MASRTDRDHLFPATSIGRTQGSGLQRGLQRVPSSDTLPAHPLFSSSHSSPPSTDQSTGTSGVATRYVPYTPRQRVSPTAATTGTIVHPPSPQHQQGDAMNKLQLVNLKAAVQNIGLDTASVGWAILEKLVYESDHHDSEWAEVWTAITTGKATLLLPLEPSSQQDKLTPEFVKDHIVLCDGPSRNNASLVSLSGLRGTLNQTALTFRSTIHPSSKVFQDLLSPISRSYALSVLPDLPLLPSTSYSTFNVPSYATALPLPPKPVSPQNKPSVSSRSGSRAASSSAAPVTTSRISNPFTSLFGGSGHSHHPKPPVAVPSSPTASLRSLDSNQLEPIIEVPAFTIDRRIDRKDVAKEMNKALRREIKKALTLGGTSLPSWVIDRVHEFTVGWYPFVKEKSPILLGRSTQDGESSGYEVSWIEEAPEPTSERVQDFYLALEQELRLSESSFLSRLRRGHEHEDGGESSDDGKRVKEKIDKEAKIKEIVDIVERTVCSLFYDRLYMQPTSDDSSHDETLSSRVAALNMLDLALEHLDIHADNGGKELDMVVKACGETLSQLQTCRSPCDKAALLVSAHKTVVDGLSRLPPIRLMTEDESKAQKAKNLARTKAEAPPRQPDGTLRILMPMGSPSTPNPTNSARTGSTSTMIGAPPPTQDDLDLATPHTSARHAPPIPTINEQKTDVDTANAAYYSPIPSPTPVQPALPVLTVPTTAPAEPTPVSGDVLLPLIIFSVVKANPPHLVSSLLFTQRYRNQSVGGEESYCLINLMAVAEFLENVDLTALGLGDIDKVLSAADLTPIPLNRTPIVNVAPLAPVDGLPGGLRDRVEQANKVITGVVDSSFGMLRSLLPVATPAIQAVVAPAAGTLAQSPPPLNTGKPGFGLLRRESGFSIRSIAAALPMSRGALKVESSEETGQQLITVSRPASAKSTLEEKEDESGVDDSEAETGNEDGEEDDERGDETNMVGDSRSIRSFESMLHEKGKKRKHGLKPRKSLTDRLAHMSGLAGLKPQNSGLVPPQTQHHSEIPASSRPHSPDLLPLLRLAPPIQRFIDIPAGDLKLSEVGELLQEYRRLVEGIRTVKGFDE